MSISTKSSAVGATAEKLSNMRDENITHLVKEELLLQWIAGIVFGLLALALFFFIYTLLSRTFKNRKNAKVELLNQKYQMFLSELVSGTEDVVHADLGLRVDSTLSLDMEDLKGGLSRVVLKENILELYRFISGPEKNTLRNVYLMLGYAKEGIKNMKKGNAEKKVQAIDELSMLHVRDAYKELFALVNDKSEVVRDAAIAARARRDEQPLSILDELKYPLTKWQQTGIYNALIKYHTDNVPSFRQYISSTNQDIACFSINLAGHFQQADCIEGIVSRLYDDVKEVRIEAAKSLSVFASENTKQVLRDKLNTTDDAEEICVLLKSIQLMVDDTDVDWLLDMMTHNEREIVIESAKVLAQLGKVNELRKQTTPENKMWIDHAIDKTIHAL